MSRLPRPGSDDDVWGDILNDFLSVSLNDDGSLKDAGKIASAVQTVNGKAGPTVSLSANDVGAATDTTVVHNTGNETVAGTKTFTSSPTVPTPTLGSQAANKTYVDSVAGGGGGGGGSTTLAGDTDVAIASPQNNQVLTYNGASSKWVNQAAPSAPVTSVAGKTGAVTLAEGDITNLTADLAAKAPLASPTFTGTVTVPGPTNSTDAATKGYVDTAVTGSANVTTGTQSDPTATSITATTAGGGSSNTAGTNAVAIGDNASAAGNNTVAIGYNATTSGAGNQNNIAIGHGSFSGGSESVAVGDFAEADGNLSISIGTGWAKQDGAISIGTATAGGINSIGIGSMNTGSIVHANGDGSVAIGVDSSGNGAFASGQNSTTLGGNSLASGDYSTAIGSGTAAQAPGSVAIGVDSSGQATATSTADEIKLGTGAHSVMVLGKLNTAASNGVKARLNLPHGTAPTTPVDGDIWTTSSGIFTQINGTTVQLGSGTVTPTFSYTGTLATYTGDYRWYNDTGRSLSITSARASVGSAPTGSSIIVDVLKNGSTIFTTTSNRPTIAATGNTGLSGAPDVTTIANGEYLTINIAQVGSTTPGADLTVTVVMA